MHAASPDYRQFRKIGGKVGQQATPDGGGIRQRFRPGEPPLAFAANGHAVFVEIAEKPSDQVGETLLDASRLHQRLGRERLLARAECVQGLAAVGRYQRLQQRNELFVVRLAPKRLTLALEHRSSLARERRWSRHRCPRTDSVGRL